MQITYIYFLFDLFLFKLIRLGSLYQHFFIYFSTMFVSFKLLQEKELENVPRDVRWKSEFLIGKSSNFHTQEDSPS